MEKLITIMKATAFLATTTAMIMTLLASVVLAIYITKVALA